MRRARRWPKWVQLWVVAVTVAMGAPLSACSSNGSGDTDNAAAGNPVQQAAATTLGAESARFATGTSVAMLGQQVEVKTIGVVSLPSGDLKGDLSVSGGGEKQKGEVVMVGDQLYLRQPGGRWSQRPDDSSLSAVFPAALLHALEQAQNAKVDGAEPAAGNPSASYTATVPGEALDLSSTTGAASASASQQALDARIEVDDSGRVGHLTLSSSAQSGTGITVTATFSDFGVAEVISPPPNARAGSASP